MKMTSTLSEIPLNAVILTKARNVIATGFGGSEAAFCCICWLATGGDESHPSREARLAEGVSRFLFNQLKE